MTNPDRCFAMFPFTPRYYIKRDNHANAGIVTHTAHETSTGRCLGFIVYERLGNIAKIVNLHVIATYRHQGVGRMLVYSVPTPYFVEHTHIFWQSIGMQRRGNSYYRDVMYTFCAGNNKEHPRLAFASGCGYGCNQFDKPKSELYMFDVEFLSEKQNWQDFMEKIRHYRPIVALATDYTDPKDKDKMLSEVEDL